ncbi:hypothetical protein DU508_09595 [Pedobacter chinensis]|uniref:Uncharacterized protein n=1 Tax=Pedobacter chinensis TaxID=2282421 RepID=A0A369Q386_9SPHI|nr:hypothetical protein [Pedobacter chinensis]RDC57399.1 hypothetical protein DU508_09595 [Pedobacter chinensis]
MKTIFLITLFIICIVTSNAQNPVLPKISEPLISDFHKKPPFNDSLLINSFSKTKFQGIKQQGVLKSDLLLRDTTKHAEKFFSPKITNPFADNFHKTSLKDSLFIDNFSTRKFQRIPQLGFIKRDLLLRDTDRETRLIYLSSDNNSSIRRF